MQRQCSPLCKNTCFDEVASIVKQGKDIPEESDERYRQAFIDCYSSNRDLDEGVKKNSLEQIVEKKHLFLMAASKESRRDDVSCASQTAYEMALLAEGIKCDSQAKVL